MNAGMARASPKTTPQLQFVAAGHPVSGLLITENKTKNKTKRKRNSKDFAQHSTVCTDKYRKKNL